MAHILDKARKSYSRRKFALELLGYVIGFISIVVFLTGIILKIKTIATLGLSGLGLAIILGVIGKMVHKTVSKK